jgi:GTP cyclohydrolase I
MIQDPISDLASKLPQATALVAEAMRLLWGDALDDPSMQDTPSRVVRYWVEATEGLNHDPAKPLQTRFKVDSDDLVIVKDIPFQSLCEHHLLPVLGKAHIAYIPQGWVTGLSKLPRAVDILSRRPQLQERLTSQIGTLLVDTLNPLGVAVLLEAEHTCMSGRGVRKSGALTRTSFLHGVLRDDAQARAEVFDLLR